MEDSADLILKKICCTCLSVDRNLIQLSRVNDGVNKLFFLLSYDSDAYEAMFHKDAINLFVCWECKALMAKLCNFRDQACSAQKRLTDITDGKIGLKSKLTLSKLNNYHQNSYDREYIENDETIDNFIDCGPDIEGIKTESDDDDIPLSNLRINNLIDREPLSKDNRDLSESTGRKLFSKRKRSKLKATALQDDTSELYTIVEMTDDEAIEAIEKRKLMEGFVDASSKCETCVEVFKDYNELEKHNLELHVEKQQHIQCDICHRYIRQRSLSDHRREHHFKYICATCGSVSYDLETLACHLRMDHCFEVKWSKIRRKITKMTKSKSKREKTIKDVVTTQRGYPCGECGKYFENKNKRYKHIQKFHRDGFECSTCGKKFAFKNTLTRHEQLHRGPLPREQCPTCGKMVRADLRQSHARTHALRQAYDCRACDKRFVSRASYENHLKYSRRHAVTDVLKYKCSMCEKGYRSRGELRDHVNYQHMGKTQHKCPICDKALATRRCITRHVRRAHHGVKENARDKICQTCGKAFRDKKCLREHELIHTGERPLSCSVCGRTFRQSASLYTHRKRVHNIVPKPRIVLHTDDSKNNEINT